eukprot:6468950-Amphidinium_carterae.1
MAPKKRKSEELVEENVQRLIVDFAVASQKLTTADVKKLLVLVEVLKRRVVERVVEWLGQVSEHPILVQYSSDCTPASHRKRFTVVDAGGKSVNRSGAVTSEFLVQHMLFTGYSGETLELEHQFVHVDPLELCFGKSMIALATCALSFPCVAFAPSRFWAKECMEVPVDASTDGVAALYEWHLLSHCACHDAHNALKWAHFNAFGDSQLMTNVFVGVSCYRYCYSQSLQFLRVWLGQVLEGVDVASASTSELLSELYTFLGAAPEVVEVASQDMRLQYGGGKLRVCNKFLEGSEALETLSSVLLQLWHVPPYSASRWLSLGPSCRGMLRCRVL